MENDNRHTEAMERLAKEVSRINSHRFLKLHSSPVRLLLLQFMRGLAFGLGSAVGATLLLSFILWWLAQIEFIPIIGDWAAGLVREIQTHTK